MNEDAYRRAERALWQAVGVEPTERRLELGRTGCTIRVLEVGDGPPVLFVHGAANGATGWAPLAGRLGGFRCILVDRPGNCLSPRRDGAFESVQELTGFAESFVVDVLDALGVERAHLVGNSFGGMVTLRAAAAHGDRFGRVVQLSWPVGAPIARTPFAMRVGTLPHVGELIASIPPPRSMMRPLLKQIGLRDALESGRFGDTEIDWFHAVLRHTPTMRNEVAAGPRLATLRGMNTAILFTADDLAAIEVPTLFLWGENDPMGGADIARAFVAQIPNAELELLPGMGHAPWMDDPERIATRVAAFLTPVP